MNVFLKNVDIGSEYDNKVYDYWIIGQLNSGYQIDIFDATPFDLRKYEKKSIECLIIATFIEIVHNPNESNDPLLKGNFLGKYVINDKWVNAFEGGNIIYKSISEWYAIKTDEGIFLLTLNEEDFNSMKALDEVYLKVGRYDLLAWLPIEE